MGAMAQLALPLAMNAIQGGRQNKAASQQAEAANQAAAEQYEREAARRRSLLDREMASARARLGAMGVGGAGGSAAALLEGMQQRSDEDVAELHNNLACKTAIRPAAGGGNGPDAAQIGLHVLRPFIGGR